MSGSVSFDRASQNYDATRTIDDRSLAILLDALEAEVLGRGPVLEIGVGTGQLALPLAGRWASVIGLDLSGEMMAVLRGKATDRTKIPLVQADATRLPLASASLGGAYARWVLHLIPAWRQVLRELDRIVVPDGRVAIEPGGFSGPFLEIYRCYQDILGDAVSMVGLSVIEETDELDDGFAAAGWAPWREVPILYDRSITLREVFDQVPAKHGSWTWRVPDDALAAATDSVRAWAEDRFGDLDRPLPPQPASLRIYGRSA